MDTSKYLETLLDGSGHLNLFPRKLNEKAPDYGGFIKINDDVYRLSAWVKSKGGKKSLALKANKVDDDGNWLNSTKTL